MARHSETLEELVVYQKLYDDCSLWVRPLKMFLEDVEVKGKIAPRFRYVNPDYIDMIGDIRQQLVDSGNFERYNGAIKARGFKLQRRFIVW